MDITLTLRDLSNQLGDIFQLINVRLNEVERLIRMATQAEVDAITISLAAVKQRVDTLGVTLTADDAGLAAEIAALKTANPTLDVTALQAALADAQTSVSTLSTAVDSTTALVPAVTPAP